MYKQIKSFEDACKALKIGTELPDVSKLPERHAKAIVAHYKLVIIAQALNEGWVPDWSNRSEWKYYPWFDVEASKEQSSGSGLSYYVCVCVCTHTPVGSRLAFKSEEVAKYAGTQFVELYEEYYLIR